MVKLCQTKMTVPPHPHSTVDPYLLINIPSLSIWKTFDEQVKDRKL